MFEEPIEEGSMDPYRCKHGGFPEGCYYCAMESSSTKYDRAILEIALKVHTLTREVHVLNERLGRIEYLLNGTPPRNDR